ncbi:hypothetical protein SLE2022_269640 [Rubroshorea leprosula]
MLTGETTMAFVIELPCMEEKILCSVTCRSRVFWFETREDHSTTQLQLHSSANQRQRTRNIGIIILGITCQLDFCVITEQFQPSRSRE